MRATWEFALVRTGVAFGNSMSWKRVTGLLPPELEQSAGRNAAFRTAASSAWRFVCNHQPL